MDCEVIYERLVNVIESYFKLKHVPFFVEVKGILYSLHNYSCEDIDVIALEYLASLVDNTDKYIQLCTKDGGYLFEVTVKNETIKIMVEVKLK